MPTTRYTCCVVEYTVDNSKFESCNNVTTQSRCAAYGQNSVNANYNATITNVTIFFVILLVVAVCIVIINADSPQETKKECKEDSDVVRYVYNL